MAIQDVTMLSIINNNRDALLSISGTRLWSGQNAQGYNCAYIGLSNVARNLNVTTANAISWGALGPQMFGPGSTYHMVPIALAIGLVLPLPFYLAVRPSCSIESTSC